MSLDRWSSTSEYRARLAGLMLVAVPILSGFYIQVPTVRAGSQPGPAFNIASPSSTTPYFQPSVQDPFYTPAPIVGASNTQPWLTPAWSPQIPPVHVSTGPQEPFVSGSLPCPGSSADSAWKVHVHPGLWQPYLSGIFKGGTERVLGQAQRMIPLFQTPEELVFADLRTTLDDQHSVEANIGLAQRVISSPYGIFGSYVFYDIRQTAYNNNFQQITVGMEYLAIPFEARVNGYIPLTGAKAAAGATAFNFTGSSVLMRAGQERAYGGVDCEYGWLLADYGFSESRAFLGGYYFGADAAGYPDIAGPKVRMESRSFDVPGLGRGSRLTIGAEYQWDQIRDHQFNALVRLVLPLGNPAMHQNVNSHPLARRMLDRIVRDDDIVTHAAAAGPQEATVAIPDATTRISLGANTAVVTAETDNSIQNAIADTGTNVVLINGSAGEFRLEDTVELRDGQSILGGGVHVVGAVTGLPAFFGQRPTINGTRENLPVFVAANNSSIRGLTITGGRNGIQGNGTLSNISILDNQISGAAAAGLSFDFLESSTVSRNSATNNAGAGFVIEDNNGGTVSDNRALNNGLGGFLLTINGGTISGNTANRNNGDGFFITNNNAEFIGNRAYQNSGDGFSFEFQDNLTSAISDNRSTSNGGAGFNLNGNSPASAGGNTASSNVSGNEVP
ncbi:MAG: right-handed parallel beta-helix repeat-containing protein [Fuerstiella sp.]|nr:right-handed parallel beta-helix repeat-containing protein [Fuerstiella sp.]